MALLCVLAGTSGAAAGDTIHVSAGSNPDISSDGRFVAFVAGDATNLVPGDTNGFGDVFVRDLQTGTTERVSVGTSGNQANGNSFQPSVSGDGRFVAFQSDASNLVPGDTNGVQDTFVRDLQTDTTQRVSVDSSGNQANGESRYDTDISSDGRFVAFPSMATNLVPGDTNDFWDFFVHDRQTGITERVNVDDSGNQASGNGVCVCVSISPDGRFVGFTTTATNLVPGDTNNARDAFVRDLQTDTTRRVSVDSSGNQANNDTHAAPSISSEGRFVAFSSLATNLVPGDTNVRYDIFVRDLQSGTTKRVSVNDSGTQANDDSYGGEISPDGRFVAFRSEATNLVPGDTNGFIDIFVRDLQSGTTKRVSVGTSGNQANADSFWPSISTGGSFVSFQSSANNLASNGLSGVFVHEPGTIADTTPPRVDSTSPVNNATGIASTANVSATFSEDMDQSTLTTSTFTLTKQGSTSPLAATVGYDGANRKATLDPASDLASNTTYTATIKGGSTGAKDPAGNALAQDHSWTFTTAAPPAPTCTITGTATAETISGTSGADVICARGGNDTVKGLGGNDILKGEDGNDTLLGGVGDDTLNGGLGTDTASYSASLTAVIASLATNSATGEGSDTFAGVENLLGSSMADTLTGSGANNTLTGSGGNDTERGGAGNDNVVGGGGADFLYGEDGADTVNSRDGVNGNDSLNGGAGTDTKVTDTTEKSIVGFP